VDVHARQGRAVQVDPIKPALKAPRTKRLELIYDGALPNFAFKFNLRRYNKLLPIHVVWQARMTYRTAFRRYGAELAACATTIATRDDTPPALSFTKFDEALLSLFGPFFSFVPEAEKRAAFSAFADMPSMRGLQRGELTQEQVTRDQFPAAVVGAWLA